MDNGSFGRLLRDARQRAVLTLESLSERSGVSVRAISDMERGRSLPRSGTLNELMDALDLDEEQRRHLVRASARRTDQVPRQLPPDLVLFSGRDDTIASARALAPQAPVPDGSAVTAVISGMAGVGKTTFAVHWAHQVAPRFPDGQLYVNLRGFEDAATPLQPGDVLSGFLRALGVSSKEIPADTRDRGALFRERTASRRLIVLLDNARTAEQVRPLLPGSPGCLTLVTSRNRLTGLAATEGADFIGLETLNEAEALAMLSARIGDERCRAEPEAAAELVALCGGLPLAVAVVGAQLGSAPRMRLRLAVRELRESGGQLDALSSDDRRIDVRAVFSHSYRALTRGTARFFLHLAVHPGPAVSTPAAASLAAVDLPTARRCLRELAAASLLSHDSDGRFVLHDLVRAYGTELVDPADRLAAEARLLEYLHRNALTANRVVTGFRSWLPDDPAPEVVRVTIEHRDEGLDWFRQEEQAVTAALHTLDHPHLRRRLVHVAQEWVAYNALAGRWSEEITASRIGLDAALALDDPLAITRSCRYLARALVETGRLDEADEPVDLILRHIDRLPLEHRPITVRGIALVRGYQNRASEVLRHASRSLDLARRLGQRHEAALAELDMGSGHLMLGDHQRAIDLCLQGIPVLHELKDHRNEAVAWDNIGSAQHRLGDLDSAVVTFRKAIRIYEGIHYTYGEAEALEHLGSSQLELGNTEQAYASWTRAAGLFEALRVPRAAQLRAKAAALRADDGGRTGAGKTAMGKAATTS